jgi:hypothetical protein
MHLNLPLIFFLTAENIVPNNKFRKHTPVHSVSRYLTRLCRTCYARESGDKSAADEICRFGWSVGLPIELNESAPSAHRFLCAFFLWNHACRARMDSTSTRIVHRQTNASPRQIAAWASSVTTAKPTAEELVEA